jgi:dihydroflavonol-4-reductase
MKYVVTGATGFLGTHVVRALEARGHEVIRFSRSTGGDVLNSEDVRNAANGCEGVFHCAGKVSRKPEDAEDLYRLHVEGTRAVLAACAAERVRRVVVASTSGTVAVSEQATHVATEDDPPPLGIIGRWPYYRAKLFAEQSALAANSAKLEVICVNPSLLLGPGDERGSSTGDVRLFLEGGVAAVPAGGLSFVDVRDAAEAMRLAMDRGRPGERYLVGACNLTMREFLGRLARIARIKEPMFSLPRSREFVRVGAEFASRLASRIGVRSPIDPITAEMAQFFWYLDASKARSQLGFRARDPNITLHDTIVDLRARGVVWPDDESVNAFS